MTDPNKDVHTEHCCVEHGCKYGQEDHCPVYQGRKKQSHPCESCCDFPSEDYDPNAPIPTVSDKVIQQRRNEAEANSPWDGF